ncbi:MAG: hypothetical protein R2705_14200 [Ilumatobacteraceae bacterium]
MSVRREVFDEIGTFRIGRVGTLSIGQENDETELCIQALQRFPGRRFVYAPDVRVVNPAFPAPGPRSPTTSSGRSPRASPRPGSAAWSAPTTDCRANARTC